MPSGDPKERRNSVSRKLAGMLAALGLVGGMIGAASVHSSRPRNSPGDWWSAAIVRRSTGRDTVQSNGLVTPTRSRTIADDHEFRSGSAPFFFVVTNTGCVTDVLTVPACPTLSSPWSVGGDPFATVPLAAGDCPPDGAGVHWTDLGNADLGTRDLHLDRRLQRELIGRHLGLPPGVLPQSMSSDGPEASHSTSGTPGNPRRHGAARGQASERLVD